MLGGGESKLGPLGTSATEWPIVPYLTVLVRASASASNATFTEVSVKTTLTLLSYLRLSLSPSAFGKGLISAGLTWCILLSEVDRPVFKPDVEGWLLTSKFEFEVW
jgi:hypothetical protein